MTRDPASRAQPLGPGRCCSLHPRGATPYHAGRPRRAHRPRPLDDRPARRRAARAADCSSRRGGSASTGGRPPIMLAFNEDAGRGARPPTSAPRTRGWRSPTWRARSWPRTPRTSAIAARARGGARAGRRALRQAARRDRARGGRRPRNRDRRPGPGGVRDRAAGEPADHARLGRLRHPGLVRRPLCRVRCWSTTTSTSWRSASTGCTGAVRRHLLFVKVGTGIGCGIVADGQHPPGRAMARPATSATSVPPATTT